MIDAQDRIALRLYRFHLGLAREEGKPDEVARCARAMWRILRPRWQQYGRVLMCDMRVDPSEVDAPAR